MTDWNEPRAFARELIERMGGSDAAQRQMTLAERCDHAAKMMVEQAIEIISKELGGDSYWTLHQLVFTQLPPFDWEPFVNPKEGSPGLRNLESSIVVLTMNVCMYGTPNRTDKPKKMGVKPAARFVAGILTAEGIQMSPEKAARLYRRDADTIELMMAARPGVIPSPAANPPRWRPER